MEYIDINKSPDKLADDLSLFGHAVESIEKVGDDFILDLEITPNRGDCLSILGIARELAALYNLKFKTEKSSTIKNIEEAADMDKKIEVKIADPKICPRFTARIIENIKVQPSPKWMQERLKSYGFRPINNIVDITNFIMIAFGQPLHAFDWDKIIDGLMNIRLSQKGETLTTLDGKSRLLPKDAIIIEDKEKIYDLAGIMGGQNSQVDQNTSTIILQGAIFNPALIRRASKHLKLTTDASYRYERGVDFEDTIRGVDEATGFILKSCSQAKISKLIDIKKNRQDIKIPIQIDNINRLIGTDLSFEEAESYLKRLEFRIDQGSVTVPSYREFDIKIWQDLAEEISRIYGYYKIKKVPIKKVAQKTDSDKDFLKRQYLKDYLTDFGFIEVYSYSFIQMDKIPILGYSYKNCIEIANPLSKETQFLRPSIFPSLVNTIAKNPWAPEINIFEIGKVFNIDKESWQLGIATTNKDKTNLKMRLDFLAAKANISKINQKILDSYKIRRPVNYLLIDLDDIKVTPRQYRLSISQNKYRPISKFAPTIRDLAFVVEKDLKANLVEKYVETLDEKILICEVFDEFLFDNGTKNLALHIWLQNLNGPLADKEVNEITNNIIKKVEEKFSCKLRR
ncbi:MAG: phenylalanine--tRNA ligase subunit beta [Patescibacteria group bacterium]